VATFSPADILRVVLFVLVLLPFLGFWAAGRLWSHPHECPAPIRLEASSYRTHEWRTPSCVTCAWAPVRRIASAVLAVLAITYLCLLVVALLS
jgi:hypothetical protein